MRLNQTPMTLSRKGGIMTEEELTQYILDKSGDDGRSTIRGHDSRSLRARYRWLGEKSFSIDPENKGAIYCLPDEVFLLFALKPSLKQLHFVQTLSGLEHVNEFKKLATSSPNLDWDAAYEYFDEVYPWYFGYMQQPLKYYRDELLRINTEAFPVGRRRVTHHKMPNHEVHALLAQKLRESGHTIINMTKKDIAIATSRYRWFGDELFDVYKDAPLRIFYHDEGRFLMHMLFPSVSPTIWHIMTPEKLNFRRPTMTSEEKIKYDTPEPNCSWGQIWGYMESRPTAIPDKARDAIKLQFRNQFSYDMI